MGMVAAFALALGMALMGSLAALAKDFPPTSQPKPGASAKCR